MLTYNVLHGFEVRGWTVSAGDSIATQAARFDFQSRQLSLVQPDVILLQEVNPLPEKAEAYVTALKTSAAQYSEVHQVDACGICLFGLGIIPGLKNGLAVLLKAPLRIRKVDGLKLSGGIGGCGDFFGLQLNEFRYALIAEIENPVTGNKFLAVNLHLHSGIERTAYFLQRVNEVEEQGILRPEELQDFVAALDEDQNRRLDEIRVLIKELLRLQAEGTYLGTVVGGDFNFEPDSPEYRELRRAGLRDTYVITSPRGNLYSYDPEQNVIASREELTLPPSLRKAMTNLPEGRTAKNCGGLSEGRGASKTDRLSLSHGKAPGRSPRMPPARPVWKTHRSLGLPGIRSLWRAGYIHRRPVTVLIIRPEANTNVQPGTGE